MSKVRCPYCEEIIESLYTHDYKECKCGKTFVDGGQDYCRTTVQAIFISERV